MKRMKFNAWMLILPVAAMAFLSSCGGDEDEAPKPTVTLSITGDKITGNEVEVSSDISISASATAGSENLKSVLFTVKINGGAAITVFDSAITGKTFTAIVPAKAVGSTGDEVQYILTVNDANGSSAQATVNLSIIPKLQNLGGAANQIVYNSNSQGQDIAYDLIAGFALQKASKPIDQDLKDATVTGAAQWSKTWTSGNGTKFVKVTTNDWNNATTTTYLFNLYKANKDKMTAQYTFATNDVVLVKSTQDVDFNIYILKIGKLTDLPAVGNNNDFVQFDYQGINYPK